MVYIVHGENLAKSRAQIANQQKKLKTKSRIDLDISLNSFDEIQNAVASTSLFGDPVFIVLDISSLGRKQPKNIIQLLEKVPERNVVVILSKKELSKTNFFIKNALSIKAKVISNEKNRLANIFKFTDALFYRKKTSVYKELQKLMLEKQNEIYIFTMILVGLRNVALAKFNNSEKLSPFVRTKAKKQAEGFSENKIRELYKQLYKLDKRAKLGEIPLEILIPSAIEYVID